MKTPEHKRSDRRFRLPRLRSIGKHALSYGGNANEVQQEWATAHGETKEDRARVEQLKGGFLTALESLIRKGAYHPRLLEYAPDIRLIPLFHGQDDEAFGQVAAYMEPGGLAKRFRSDNPARSRLRLAGIKQDSGGRYLTARSLKEADILTHELAHVAVNIGDPVEYQIFREPITNRLARDVMEEQGLSGGKLDRIYQPHESILSKIEQASGLDARATAYITSGPNPLENEQNFNAIVTERLGWDAAGFAQQRYLSHIYDSGLGLDQAALAVESELDAEFQNRTTLQVHPVA